MLLYAVLAAMNLGAWSWAVVGLGGRPALLDRSYMVGVHGVAQAKPGEQRRQREDADDRETVRQQSAPAQHRVEIGPPPTA